MTKLQLIIQKIQIVYDKKNGWIEDGWVKVAKNVQDVEIHYLWNTITNAFDDFKFVDN